MLNACKSRLNKNKGFSLIELMVGLVIGGIATIVIMQVFSTFEGQKRTTTGSADAQTNASLALYNLQRDIQMAGFGLPIFDLENSPMKCPTEAFTIAVDLDNDPLTPDENVEVGIFPITIQDGGGDSDTITVRYSRSNNSGGVPVKINASPFDDLVPVPSNQGCNPPNPITGRKDIAIITSPPNCELRTVTGISAPTGAESAGIYIELDDVSGITVNSNIACLGSDWGEVSYRVEDGQLLRSETYSGEAPNVANIINIQAQYGVSASVNTTQVVNWVNANDLDVAQLNNRNRIRAVRVAVVARSGQPETANVSVACSSTTLANPTGVCAWSGTVDNPAPVVDLTGDPDWRLYRYRVFETIIPLRNVIWSRDAL